MKDAQIKAETIRQQSGGILMRVTLLDGDKIIKQNDLSIDAFVALLTDSQYREESPKPSFVGETPEGYVDGFVTTQEGTLGAIFYLPPQRHQFVLAGSNNSKRKAYYLAMPGLVYLVVLNKGAKRTMYCFAAKEYEGDETPLYQYPFGNVSGSGDVCMGTISVKGAKDFRGIRQIIEDSLDGVTNSDYLESGKVRLAVDMTQSQFCEENKDTEEFPLNLLLGCVGKFNTIADLKKELALIAKTL